MAHSDYDCCANCSSKMSYNAWDAQHKGQLCQSCTADLAGNGVPCKTIEDFIGWLKSPDRAKVKEILQKFGFEQCYYQNEVDDAVKDLFPSSLEDSPTVNDAPVGNLLADQKSSSKND